ncbi:MAG: CHAP domain-containing protein, partial [Chloroflexota bacterium]|nr:CHAP domain-containing protein [Chloroflexota bacterium]
GTRGTTITFRVGGILPADILPPGHNWRDQTLSEWRRKSQARAWSAGWQDPCNAAAEARTGNLRSVILANMASGPEDTIGYAGQGTGPAISLTVANHEPPEKNLGYTRRQSFYYTVAHEIGHAFYDWEHPWEDGDIDQPPTPEQLMSVMSQPLRGAKLNLAPGEANSAYIACYHLKQHHWVDYEASGECQRPDSTTPEKLSEPGDPDDEDPSELELRISWGSDASGRSDCPPDTSCRYLRYEYIGGWPQPPYQTECWSNGQRGFGPFNWLGDPRRGCIFWDDDVTAQVVVNGVRSNEITFNDRTPPPTTTLPRTRLSTSYPTVTDCWGRDPDWDGYQLGQCTSYVAWRLRENGVGENDHAYAGKYGFYNQWRAAPCAAIDRAQVARWGHARQWDDCAERIGIRVDKSPAPGSVLVRNDTALDSETGQFFGHLAYVEATNPDGSIIISDGNYNGRCGIRTSRTVEKGTGPYQGDYRFIHFENHAKRLAS